MKAAPRGGFLPNNGAGERAGAKLSSGAAAVSQYSLCRPNFAVLSLCAPETSFSKALPRRWRKPPRQPRFHFLLNSMIYLKDTFITHRKTTTSLKGPLNVPARKCFLTLSPVSSPCHASCPLQRRRKKSMITPRIIFEIKRSNVFERRLSGVRSFRFCVTPR